MSRPSVLAVGILVTVFFVVGCSNESSEDPAELPPSSTPGSAPVAGPEGDSNAFDVRGVYLGAVFDSAAAVVSHEAVPGFMDAMRMQIRVASPAELRGLHEGDKIRFRLTDPDGNGYEISAVETLPPGTDLVLADTAEAAVPDEASVPAGAPVLDSMDAE